MERWEINKREETRGLMRDAVRQVLAEQEPLRDTIKDVFREAIAEWMEDKFKEFGKWSLKGIAVAAFGTLVYFVMVHSGWTPPHK